MRLDLEQEHSTYLQNVRKQKEVDNPYLEELLEAEREIEFLSNVVDYLAQELARDNPLFSVSEIKNRAYYFANVEKEK